MADVIVAAADGSSLSNPGPSGWAWYVDEDHWAAGGWKRGTNNMGELMAVLDLLKQTAQAGDDLHVLCDSQYVINSLTRWMPGWKRKGWKKADGKPVLNVELLQQLDRELAGRTVTFEWVKGHAGHTLNEAADQRARDAATAFQQGRPVAAGPGWGASAPATAPAAGTSGKGRTPAASERPAERPAEPKWGTHEEPDALIDEHEVIALQRSWLSDAVRGDRDAADALLHARFVEHDVVGRVSGKGRTLATLRPLPSPVEVEVLGVEELAPWVVLVRWKATSASGDSVRASIWTKREGRWQLRFEQATGA